MVARKNSIPYPTSPPPPPPNFAPPTANHTVNTADLPPIPPNAHRREEDSPYQDMGNPWVDNSLPVNTTQINHPAALRPGVAKSSPAAAPAAAATAAPEISDVLQPGWSGQNTPRSSIDSGESKGFWESSEDEEEKTTKGKAKAAPQSVEQQQHLTSESTEDLVIPSSLQIKRKPVGLSPMQDSTPAFALDASKPDFSSNNPFRKTTSTNQPVPVVTLPSWGSDIKGKGKENDVQPMPQLQNLSLNNDKGRFYSVYNQSASDDATTQWQQQQHSPPQPNAPPPPIPAPHITSPFSEQPPLIPVSPKADEIPNPWSSQQSISAQPSPIPFAPSQKQNTYSSESLLDRGPKADGRIYLGDELKALPNAAQTSTSQISLLDDDLPPTQTYKPPPITADEEYAPPPGPPPSHKGSQWNRQASPPPPIKPVRPAIVIQPMSDTEIAELQEQRNETYQIKHFNWFDHKSGNLRMSSMLTQNKNGPCPLLALVNALILGIRDESQAALDDALKTREQVTLGLIIETLMDELLTSGAHLDGELPDVDELNKFLIKLRTGMNMNPRFVQPQAPPPNLMDARNSMLHMPSAQSQDQPGSFESSQDIRLYSAFGIKTVHGWLPEPGSQAVGAFKRSAQNYEDAQVIQFGEEELDYKLSNGGLTPQEQRLWEDIVSIKSFFGAYPTQLTPYGLTCIKQSMQPGSFAILFRNDHFSTIYKHPRDGNLYTLITDAGYADRDEIIWESLVDISGQQSEFFSGDFQSVSHNMPSSRRQSGRLSVGSIAPEPLSPQQQQEQHDADFAMALQLQEEEEQRMRQERSNRSSTGGGTGTGTNISGGRGAGRGGTAPRRGQGIPISLRGNNSATEIRPLIPPRNQRSNIPAVNRPSDAEDSDAPPTYEEAARGKPYNPPIGSPLHPQSTPNGEPSPYNSTSNVDLAESSERPPALRRPERRQSAYSENYERHGHVNSPRSSSGRFEFGMSPAYSGRNSNTAMPGTYVHTGQGGHGQGVSSAGRPRGNERGDDRECIVM